MREIYTRNYSRQPRYTPPPGYVGNAFTDSESLKHHPPEDDVNGSDGRFSDRNEESVSEAREIILNELKKADDCEKDENHCDGCDEHKDGHENSDHDEKHHLEELLRSFKGKIGREELIILLVMLLVASEGVGIEVLLLALILIAG